MTDKEHERRLKEIKNAKLESDLDWVLAMLSVMLIASIISIFLEGM